MLINFLTRIESKKPYQYKGWIFYEETSGFFGGTIRLYNPTTTQTLWVQEVWGTKKPQFYAEGLLELAKTYIDAEENGFPKFQIVSIKIDSSNPHNILSSFNWKTR